MGKLEGKALKVLDRLRRQCSRREYCVADVRRKALTLMEGDEAAAGEIVASLIKDRYVDDVRYACAYSREKASISGWGEAKIRFMLHGKGLSMETIAQALQEIDHQSADARLNRLLEFKMKALKDDPQLKMKLLRYAMGRGYSYESVNNAVKALLSGESDS